MQRKIDQGEPGVIRQSETQRRLHIGWYYLDLDACLRRNRNGATEQAQYPCLNLANVVKHDGWRIPQSLARNNAPHCVSERKNLAFNETYFYKLSQNIIHKMRSWCTCWSVEKLPLFVARNFRCMRRWSSSKRKDTPGTSRKMDDAKWCRAKSRSDCELSVESIIK